MKKSLLIITAVGLFALAIYWGCKFYTQSQISLTAPVSPPNFSVAYLYNFYWTNFLDEQNINTEIKNDLNQIRDANFNGIKINFYVNQDNLASNKITRLAAQNGLYPIGQLVGHDAKPKDRAFTEAELTAWENFVQKEVKKNKNLIYFWEVWNEPAMTELRFRYGTPAEYLELLKRTSQIIKQENPLAKIIVTADFADMEAEIFAKEFLELGGADYFDYLSFHPYNALDPQSRFNLDETIAQEKALSEKYHKPLWISEIGYPDSETNENRQAEVAMRLFETAAANNLPLVWFHWSDRRVPLVDNKTGWGLIRKDNSFKPAYQSLKNFLQK